MNIFLLYILYAYSWISCKVIDPIITFQYHGNFHRKPKSVLLTPRFGSSHIAADHLTVLSIMLPAEISTASPPSISLLLQQANRRLYQQKENLLTRAIICFVHKAIIWSDTMRPSPRFLAAISRSQPSKLKKPSISLDHVSTSQAWFELYVLIQPHSLFKDSVCCHYGGKLCEH